MKRVFEIGLAFSVVVAGILTLAAADTKESPAWGPKTGGCRVSLTTTHPKYRFDQPIGLRISLKNEGDAAVRAEHTNLLYMYRFDVKDSDGKPCPLTREGDGQRHGFTISSGIDIGPGDSVVFEVEMLNRLYDMSLLGEYTVTVYRYAWPPVKKAKPFEVASNKIKIIVEEDAPDAGTQPAGSEANGPASRPAHGRD